MAAFSGSACTQLTNLRHGAITSRFNDRRAAPLLPFCAESSANPSYVLLERSESSTTAAPNAENDYANGPSSSDLFVARLHRNECGVAALHRSALVHSTAVEGSLMARFRVELVQSVVETCVVYVEATNAQQAEQLALEWAGTGEPVAELANVIADWRFKDTLDDIEVLSVEELKP
jgi:hypothetical protein